jgi:hypothetical protein
MRSHLCVSGSFRQAMLFGLSLCFTHSAVISGAAAADVHRETLLKNLNRPCGIAVRPGGTADRFEVFIAESGAGNVVRWSSQASQTPAKIITGFKTQDATDPFHQTGPLALGFLDPGLLIVGAKQDQDGSFVRAYELPDGEAALGANAAADSGANASGFDGSICSALVRTHANESVPDALVMAVRAPGNRSRLLKARVQAGTIGVAKPFETNSAAEPHALAISNSGRVVVADAAGGLTFYSPIDGQIELPLKTDLKQFTALAYNPANGSLYAADFAGGVQRIEDASEPGRAACRTVKIADVARPTALAFAPDGSLYVVTFGNGDGEGTLEVLSGDL